MILSSFTIDRYAKGSRKVRYHYAIESVDYDGEPRRFARLNQITTIDRTTGRSTSHLVSGKVFVPQHVREEARRRAQQALLTQVNSVTL